MTTLFVKYQSKLVKSRSILSTKNSNHLMLVCYLVSWSLQCKNIMQIELSWQLEWVKRLGSYDQTIAVGSIQRYIFLKSRTLCSWASQRYKLGEIALSRPLHFFLRSHNPFLHWLHSCDRTSYAETKDTIFLTIATSRSRSLILRSPTGSCFLATVAYNPILLEFESTTVRRWFCMPTQEWHKKRPVFGIRNYLRGDSLGVRGGHQAQNAAGAEDSGRRDKAKRESISGITGRRDRRTSQRQAKIQRSCLIITKVSVEWPIRSRSYQQWSYFYTRFASVCKPFHTIDALLV